MIMDDKELIESTTGEIINIEELFCITTKPNKPILLFLKNKIGVWHVLPKYSQLLKLKEYAYQKTIEGIIPKILFICEKGYVLEYLIGDPVNYSTKNIIQIAKLHSEFNNIRNSKTENHFNDFFIDKAKFLRNKALLSNSLYKKISKVRFLEKSYLLHGDFSLSNIIRSNSSYYVIDLEHINLGPLCFDLIRPLIRICKTYNERILYLENHRLGRKISDDSLKKGMIAFYILQAYNRYYINNEKTAMKSIQHLKNLIEIYNEDNFLKLIVRMNL